MSEVKQYAERDLMEMDCAGNHYCRHVSAMTREQLHSKSDIAAELGWRDMQIAKLTAQRDALADENVAFKSVIEAVRGVANNSDGISGWHRNGDLAGWDEILPEIEDIETPATYAYLNSVRAEGVEMFAKHCDDNVSFVEPEDEELYTLMEEAATAFAAQLRAGKEGE